MMTKMVSELDNSVNFVEQSLTGFLESRFVRKSDDYFICYLSSQSGCSRGCKFCHLTATKQTKFEDALPVDFLSQAAKALKHYNYVDQPAKYMHYNFMARGEVLCNRHILNDADQILFDLGKLTKAFDPNLGVKFNVSTILPKTFNKKLQDVFKIIHPTIYYSFYSANPDFRKKWMPNAMDVDKAFKLLKEYQDFSKKKVKIHHALIKGENDSMKDLTDFINLMRKYYLEAEFNLVRYNPYSIDQGEEASEEQIKKYLYNLELELGCNNVKMIPRVGYDVKASCGMFVE